ncbi:MAG: hypothetical protein EA388_11700 [Nitriliruptor sp.]|nr:MAG: hypothetical protein EA388_11700 [Nitriliruptor sp.]
MAGPVGQRPGGSHDRECRTCPRWSRRTAPTTTSDLSFWSVARGDVRQAGSLRPAPPSRAANCGNSLPVHPSPACEVRDRRSTCRRLAPMNPTGPATEAAGMRPDQLTPGLKLLVRRCPNGHGSVLSSFLSFPSCWLWCPGRGAPAPCPRSLMRPRPSRLLLPTPAVDAPGAFALASTAAHDRDACFLPRTGNVGGPVGRTFTYGRADDITLVGDWNGSGTTTVGVHRVPQPEPEPEPRTESQWPDVPGTPPADDQVWVDLAGCESNNNWQAVSANGTYYGGLQFHPDTWRTVGGSGLPNQASRAEQIHRAQLLLTQPWATWGNQWPACSRRLGLS